MNTTNQKNLKKMFLHVCKIVLIWITFLLGLLSLTVREIRILLFLTCIANNFFTSVFIFPLRRIRIKKLFFSFFVFMMILTQSIRRLHEATSWKFISSQFCFSISLYAFCEIVELLYFFIAWNKESEKKHTKNKFFCVRKNYKNFHVPFAFTFPFTFASHLPYT